MCYLVDYVRVGVLPCGLCTSRCVTLWIMYVYVCYLVDFVCVGVLPGGLCTCRCVTFWIMYV